MVVSQSATAVAIRQNLVVYCILGSVSNWDRTHYRALPSSPKRVKCLALPQGRDTGGVSMAIFRMAAFFAATVRCRNSDCGRTEQARRNPAQGYLGARYAGNAGHQEARRNRRL